MSKPKIIVKPKRLATRKQRKTSVDTSYLLDENKKVHKRADNELITVSSAIPITVKQKKKKTKKEYVGRKKNRKKTRENKKAKRLQGQQDYIKKGKKKKPKTSKPTPIGIESKPTPIGIESKSVGDDYIPTVDIFDIIEQYIMSIPNEFSTWRKGTKGAVFVDMSGFKYACVSIIRDYSMSDDENIKKYFIDNEMAIKECIDGFNQASNENGINDTKEKLLNLLAMGKALSADMLDTLEHFENY